MEQDEYPRFNKLVVELFAKYPQSAMSEATIPAWWRELRKFELPAVEYAFAHVGKGNPQFCPSAEAVRELADMEAKRLDVIQRRAARGILPPAPERPELKQDSPWETLATYWHQENVHFGKHPEARPDDLHGRRWAQFWKHWGNVAGGKALP